MATDWHKSGENVFQTNFSLDVQSNKIYLLQLPCSEDLFQVKLNNTIVQGNKQNESYSYNITEVLAKENSIEISTKTNRKECINLNAQLHCVNKIYIPEIGFKLYEIEDAGNSLSIDVRVKNAFNSEQQGYLKYFLYSAKNKLITERETPVFIEGNAENLYQQQIDFQSADSDLGNLTIVCKVFINGEETDELKKQVKRLK